MTVNTQVDRAHCKPWGLEGGRDGDPHARPAAVVAEDVRQGYVLVKAAKELYGVVVDAVTFAVDEKGTRRLRERPRTDARSMRKKSKQTAAGRKSRSKC